MNHTGMKVGATSTGAIAVLALALSLGGRDHSDVASANDAVGRRHAPASLEHESGSTTAASSHGFDRVTAASSHGYSRWLDELAQPSPRAALFVVRDGQGSHAADPTTDSEPAAPDPVTITVTIPRRVTVVLPSYSGGSLPTVTPPQYEAGTAPSVEHRGSQIVIDTGERGTLSPPAMSPGEPPTITPPQVIVE